ncbi:hypothetical protein [Rheinheimera maricola]|uniref:Uncharacterized protein n=1 Tax=Rheinheimera maricola TaxID=2793282 RepID=A0ABS7X8V6_9GAMM|nr:hypothetical protein [Rheinheimera maricola]MBZ9611978.1 hypothetical protein [Rheinheimera maricola]
MNAKCVIGFFVSFLIIYFILGDLVAGWMFGILMEKNVVGGLMMMFKPDRINVVDACDANMGWCMVVLWRDYSFIVSIALSLMIASNFWDSREGKSDSVGNGSNGE